MGDGARFVQALHDVDLLEGGQHLSGEELEKEGVGVAGFVDLSGTRKSEILVSQ